jgi:hypothetical protein
MPHLEPTYLRYIYDGLIKGSIHPENAAELPDGLIGLYEEAFDERTSVVERQKLLQHFAIWALLKKEVSAAFVAEVLGESEDDIQEFISTYSAWFNSPESGKYQLYHERLKVYLLQKMSEEEIHSLHEKIIERFEKAIEAQKADEFEWYGLEFLTSHLAVAAMLNGDGKKLIDLAYSQTYWQRQLKISKGYSWTNNGLKEVMTWASKYNDDEVIECGLQMVDLHHLEQNAAGDILNFIEEGAYEIALDRLLFFGDKTQFGKKRKGGLSVLLLQMLLNHNTDEARLLINKILQHLSDIELSSTELAALFKRYIIENLVASLKDKSIDIPGFLQVLDETENNETQVEVKDNATILSQLILTLSEKEIETTLLNDLNSNDKNLMLERANQFLEQLAKDKRFRINQFNKVVGTLAEILLENQVLNLHAVKEKFKVSLTTKSQEYNSFLSNWIASAIRQSNWTLTEEIIDACFDMQIKAKAICDVALVLPADQFDTFIQKYLAQIQITEQTIEILFNAGSLYQNGSVYNNPFYLKGLSLELESSVAVTHESLSNALQFVNNQTESKPLLKLLELTRNHIANAANNLNIREFALLKMLIKSLSVLVNKSEVQMAVVELQQLYYAMGELEDWLELVSQVFESFETDATYQSGFIQEIAPFVYNLCYTELNTDLSDRQKKRLLQGNYALLQTVFIAQRKENEWQGYLAALQLENYTPESNKADKSVSLPDAQQRVNEIKKKIPLADLQEIADSTNELKLFTQFHIYSPRKGSKLATDFNSNLN